MRCQMRYRFVLDTNVLIAALRSRTGASFALLQKVGADERLELCLSTALLLEYEALIARFRADIALSDAAIEGLLDYLSSVATTPTIYFRWRPTLSDPNDDFLLDLAVAAQCHFVVTFNTRDLLEATKFGVEIITPAQLLRRLEKET